MISSKRINLIGILLIVITLILTVWTMISFDGNKDGHTVGTINYSNSHSVTYTADDHYTSYSDAGVSKITLNGDTASSSSNNVKINGSKITILGGGTYVLSGQLDNGSIIVDSGDKAEVRLVLNNVSVISQDFAALYIKEAEKTVVSLVDGTENYFTDSKTYNEDSFPDDMPSAAVHSNDDLTINGKGKLIVNGNYQDGIKSDDSLKITECEVMITAADEGINANDYVAILNTDITVNSVGDAIKAEHKDKSKGFIALDNTNAVINGTTDGIYSSSGVYITDGNYTITVEEDAIHGENNVVIQPETLNIMQCREGIEGAFVEINGGNISITSYDDGINAVGLNSNGGFGRPMGMHKDVITEEDVYLTINGGNIVIETNGDGVDSNGAVMVNDGNIFVYGPENNGNSSLDFEYGFVINGGNLIAVGSSGMAELPHETSKQHCLVFYLENTYSDGNSISVVDSIGNEIISAATDKRFNWVCVSADSIKLREKYSLIINDENITELEATDTISIFGNRDFGGWR